MGRATAPQPRSVARRGRRSRVAPLAHLSLARQMPGAVGAVGAVREEMELIFMSYEHHILQLSVLLPHLLPPRLVEFPASESRRRTEVL